jgi:membrane-associated phospholipid phosphatase
VLLAPSHDPSFPSDHASFGFAVAVALVCVNRRIGMAALLIAAFLAFSRVYTGEHYPGDVVVGALVGGLVAFAAVQLRPVIFPRLAPLLRVGRRLHLA